ncbi:TPA: ACP S-malonyltransferase, partial [Enterococcus faecium]|nr:ACP S-malonyltransferase [Enterococcus faecium]
MSTGFLFPGQGSQTSDMLNDVPDDYFIRLEQATGYQLKKATNIESDTVYIQLAMLV